MISLLHARTSCWKKSQVVGGLSRHNIGAITKAIQLSVVIARSNIVRYYTNNFRNRGMISIRCWIHKRHPIHRPNGRAMGCLLWIFVPHCMTKLQDIWLDRQDSLHDNRFNILGLCVRDVLGPGCMIGSRANIRSRLWILHNVTTAIYASYTSVGLCEIMDISHQV